MNGASQTPANERWTNKTHEKWKNVEHTQKHKKKIIVEHPLTTNVPRGCKQTTMLECERSPANERRTNEWMKVWEMNGGYRWAGSGYSNYYIRTIRRLIYNGFIVRFLLHRHSRDWIIARTLYDLNYFNSGKKSLILSLFQTLKTLNLCL